MHTRRSSGNMYGQHQSFTNIRKRKAFTKRMLSVTDLLARTKDNYSQYFPRIDTKKYQSNAPFSIYDCQNRYTSDDIAACFSDRRYSRTSSITSYNGYVGPKPSLTSITPIHFPEVRAVCEDIAEDCISQASDDLHSFYVDSSDIKKLIPSPLGTPILLKSPLLKRVKDRLSESSKDALLFACHIDFLPISSRVRIDVKRISPKVSSTEEGKLDFFAKISVSPGNFKKQRVWIVSKATSDLLSPKAYYDGISCTELSQLTIHVKICLRRGFLKRSKDLHELVVKLDTSKLQTAWTAVARISKSDL